MISLGLKEEIEERLAEKPSAVGLRDARIVHSALRRDAIQGTEQLPDQDPGPQLLDEFLHPEEV